mmetsp:Transcript_139863/g.339856  ORF Transcript_139863/g.339856 Transcript_139863/m.339856 type:complete len:134 (-) Transcript_139863:385-786(-)
MASAPMMAKQQPNWKQNARGDRPKHELSRIASASSTSFENDTLFFCAPSGRLSGKAGLPLSAISSSLTPYAARLAASSRRRSIDLWRRIITANRDLARLRASEPPHNRLQLTLHIGITKISSSTSAHKQMKPT